MTAATRWTTRHSVLLGAPPRPVRCRLAVDSPVACRQPQVVGATEASWPGHSQYTGAQRIGRSRRMQARRMSRWLITGAGGMLGRELIMRLSLFYKLRG